jgi:hypothetical protein
MSAYVAPKQSEELIFEYKRNGVNSGFMAHGETEYVFKPDRLSAAVISLETLKKNLRIMIKNKTARLIKAGTIEAVVVPRAKFKELFE